MVLKHPDLVLQELAAGQQGSLLLTGTGLHVNRPVKPHPHHLSDPPGIVAIGLVHLSSQGGLHVARLDADRRKTSLDQLSEQPLRQWTGLKTDTMEQNACFGKNGNNSGGVGWDPCLTNEP